MNTPFFDIDNLVITNDDIEQIVQTFGWDFYESHKKVLTCQSCQDIQACPGSGKTTLLVAKLAILSKKWHWEDQGICVLSHTNVARDEIDRRLSNDQSGYRLLDYPHFIGTIQFFIDQFLAYPYLRSKKIDVTRVDDQYFKNFVNGYVARNHNKFKGFFNEHKSSAETFKLLYNLRYKTFGDSPELVSIRALPGELSKDKSIMYQALQGLKRAALDEGLCCYDDMYTFAEAYLSEYPQIIAYVRRRFPWVFIDEMQDTNHRQETLINRLFGEGCILQRFGDINQSIFGNEADPEVKSSFPKEGHLELPISHRFGQKIAFYASNLTAVRSQKLIGNQSRVDRLHTIFLFNTSSITQVLKQFTVLLTQEYPNGLPENYVVKAVGLRKTGSAEEVTSKIPFNIGSYWPEYRFDTLSKSNLPKSLLEYVYLSRHMREEKRHCTEPYNALIKGVLEFFYRRDVKYIERGKREKLNRTRLMALLEKSGDKTKMQFYELLRDFCLPNIPLTKEFWRRCTKSLVDILSNWLSKGYIWYYADVVEQEAATFIEWSEQRLLGSLKSLKSPDLLNTYIYENNGVPIKVQLSTIHAVKGETHTATLVLETYFNKKHDLAMLLPYLIGNVNPNLSKTDSILLDHMKRIFVAMTRPKELLCLALHRDHITEGQKSALVQKGWNIINIEV